MKKHENSFFASLWKLILLFAFVAIVGNLRIINLGQQEQPQLLDPKTVEWKQHIQDNVSTEAPTGLLRGDRNSTMFINHTTRIDSDDQNSTTSIHQSDQNNSTTRDLLSCPPLIRHAIGVYNNNSNDIRGFENVLLLVSSNFAYLDFLRNWEYLAQKHGLKYGIVAMDDQLYQHLGPHRAILSQDKMTSKETRYHQKAYNNLVCNKMKIMLDLMERCHTDIVFSDVDNVFLQNPFEHDLGRLIQMQAYDYIYAPNQRTKSPRSHSCLKQGTHPGIANTGFYYLSRNSKTIKSITNYTLWNCSKPDNKLDDQKLFWSELRRQIEQQEESWHHCNASNGYDAPPNEIMENENATGVAAVGGQEQTWLCCLDPYVYQIGQKTKYERNTEDLITFHANWVKGIPKKIDLLKSIPAGWNPDEWEQDAR